MFSVNDFLDRAKRGAGIESDYALAQRIGVTRANVSNWRHDRNAPDGRAIIALCALSGDDPEHVAACVQSMRAANDEESELWRRVADRLKQSGAASIAFALLVVGLAYAGLFQADDAYAAGLGSAYSVEPRGGVTVNDHLSMIELACRGNGLAYTLDLLARPALAAGTLEQVLARHLPATSGLFLYFPAKSQAQPKLRAFIDFAAARLRKARS